MQLKLAKNSIFAHLLRSPWWASLLIAFIVGTLARLFLADIFGMGVISIAFPFLLISGIAGWRQLQAPSAARIEATIAAASAMSWKEFSAAMQQGFERDGYTVKHISGAADFLVTKEGRSSLVCCKRWKAANHGVEPLRELQAMREAQDAHGAIYVAVNDLTKDARSLAGNYGIELMQGAEVMRLLGK
ncbi:MAG: hypothetical protein H6R07_1588 [Proteobacteria bacterium]|nr:hypothetical protein [Pseudomonadota bacterium]